MFSAVKEAEKIYFLLALVTLKNKSIQSDKYFWLADRRLSLTVMPNVLSEIGNEKDSIKKS